MENEIMNYDEVMVTENEVFETEAGNSEMGTGVAMLIGAGLTLATAAIVKLGKKAYATLKAKKEQKAEEDEFEDVAYEEIDE